MFPTADKLDRSSFPITSHSFTLRLLVLLSVIAVASITSDAADPDAGRTAEPIRILFLGDDGHHRPRDRFEQLRPVFASRGIDVTYTGNVADLNAKTLAQYDGLLIYANIEKIAPVQEQALLDYVAGGKGFIPLHCASYCFLNSPKYVALVGAQFQRHGTGEFRTRIDRPDHPVMKGYRGFESWDETYVHTKHNNKNRTVLSYRVDDSGAEPWTWVRTHGDGRVFYTAWGHDHRTWGHPGFQNLLERGVRWSVGRDPSVVPPYSDAGAFPVPEMTELPKDAKPFDYVEAKVPFYPPSEKWGVIGEPITKMQCPLPPDKAQKHLTTPVDFEVKLFASEPDIGKPICMNWDERGRLWLAETVDYPNQKQPEGKGRDRIRICEDANGDGSADKFTVFAENLSIPTSLTFAYGGVVVHQAPHTLFLKDTDGDDRADVREILFTGWATNDTHAGPSNLRYGPDGWYYGMVGYAGFEGVIAGERRSFRTGFYRFRLGAPDDKGVPAVTDFEFLRNTNNNSWGVGLSEDGLLFGSTANRHPSVYMPIANRYYERVRGWSPSVLTGISDTHLFKPATEKVRQVDHHGGYTAGAGHALYTARSYPREYWNRTAFVCGPTGHLVGTFVLEPRGSDYRSRYLFNLLAANDEWSAPITAEVGPDGAVWSIDWYNYIVQHNPTPVGFKTGKGNAYETDLRDKTHGRVYRIAPTHVAEFAKNSDAQPTRVAEFAKNSDAQPCTPEFLANSATSSELVAALTDDNMFWRLHAQRLLVERGKADVADSLVKLLRDQSVDEIGLNPAAIHAVWTLERLGLLDGTHAVATAAVVAALKHPSAVVRMNAARALPRAKSTTTAILESGVLADADFQVRLQALLALSDLPASAKAAAAVLTVLDDPANLADRWIPDAATAAAAAHDVHFLKLVAGREFENPPSERLVAIVERVAEHFARGKPGERVEPIAAALSTADVRIADALVSGFERGWPREGTVGLSESTEKQLAGLLPKLAPSARAQLVRLAHKWGSDALKQHAAEIAAMFLKQAEDEDGADAERIEAARQLIEFRPDDADAVERVLASVTPRSSPELARGMIAAVGRSAAPRAGAAVVESLASQTPVARRESIRVLLGRSAWTKALLDGFEAGDVQLSELTLDQKQALAAHPDKSISTVANKLLARGGALPDPDRKKVLDRLLPLAVQSGDAQRGLEVFKKQCAKCHVHGGVGTKIGPDLTGMAVHPKQELLTQILDPSRSVEGNYRVYTVVTESGRVMSGLLASETKTTLELFDTEGKRQVVLRDEIEELVPSKKSLMPEGFEKQVKEEEIVDLLAFLTKRGRWLPIPLARAATTVSTRGMFFTKEGLGERLVFDDWSPKTVEGVPFHLVDPRGDRTPNVILLYGPHGNFAPQMPKSVRLPMNSRAKSIHFLSGVSGWGHPLGEKGTVSMIVRLYYADGETEDHPLRNGVHFADYIREIDVPESKLAFLLNGRQLRYLSIKPKRGEVIREMELVKGPDDTAPIVMAVTVETAEER